MYGDGEYAIAEMAVDKTQKADNNCHSWSEARAWISARTISRNPRSNCIRHGSERADGAAQTVVAPHEDTV
jgi:hypothetical protein